MNYNADWFGWEGILNENKATKTDTIASAPRPEKFEVQTVVP